MQHVCDNISMMSLVMISRSLAEVVYIPIYSDINFILVVLCSDMLLCLSLCKLYVLYFNVFA